MSWKKIAVLAVIIILLALFFSLDLGGYLTLENLKANQQTLVRFYKTHSLLSIAVFITIYIVQSALSLPGAAILSLAAGAIFGLLMGTIYANIGATAGAAISFLLTRYLLRNAVQKKFGHRLIKINAELEEEGATYLLFLRLVPVFPFFLINLAAALTRMPLRTFVPVTLFGIIPGAFVYCNAGASLAAVNSLSEVVSSRVIGSFFLLGLFFLIPVFYKKLKLKKVSN